MMGKKDASAAFLDILAELSASRLTVSALVKEIGAMGGLPPAVREIGKEVSALLEKGYTLSAAFSLCSRSEFSPEDLSLVLCAEETGNYGEVFKFLAGIHRKRRDAGARLALSAVYPCFVFLLVTGATAGILLNARTLFPLGASLLEDRSFLASALGNVAGAWVFMLIFALGSFGAALWVNRLPGTYYVFSILGFLTGAGLDVERALGPAIAGAAGRERLWAALVRAQDAMRAGATLENAFGAEGMFAGARFFLQTAMVNGEAGRAFTLFAAQIEGRCRARARLFLRLIEPAMLVAAGIYMLLVLKGTVLPLMLNFGGIL
ncbi:MAG: type II secretion system F family protein [Spirochaetaceae bacterium]|jgi:type II secretory pathway component PulF|nr:type II secretion system F family protein [Spirochaetaceae bacterium]